LDAADKAEVSGARGLAAIYRNMQLNGLDQLINNVDNISLANMYFADYTKSRSAQIEALQRQDVEDKEQGNYPGAEQVMHKAIWGTRYQAYYKITFTHKQAMQLPKKMFDCFYDNKNSTLLQEILRLNENQSLSPTAIHALAIVIAYHGQCDAEKQN
jgi:hypothetical protein